MASNQENTENQAPVLTDVIRENLITTAVNFLTNANVQKSLVSQREAFLRKKGLTEKEIAVALERASLIVPAPPIPLQHYQGLPSHTAVPIPLPQGYLLPPQSGWSRFRDIINTLAIIGGLTYGLYILYKRYIAPYLFGKKQSPIEESLASLDASVKGSVEAIRVDLQKVQSDLEKLNEQQYVARQYATAKQVLDVKSEITSLKGLLLSRKQFPASNEIPLLTKPTTNETPQLVQSSSEETSHLVNSPPMSISAHGIPTWQLNEDAEVEQASHREDLNESSSANLKDKNVVTNGNAISDEEP